MQFSFMLEDRQPLGMADHGERLLSLRPPPIINATLRDRVTRSKIPPARVRYDEFSWAAHSRFFVKES